MADNVIKSTDLKVEDKKPAKKATPKKVAAEKVISKSKDNGIEEGYTLVVFESGASYTSNNIRFTRDNRIQEVPEADAQVLLGLDNFRQANQFELEDYLKSKEN